MLPDRIAQRIDRTPTCWLWTGYVAPHGYGRVRYQGKQYGVHRLMYALLVGPIPEGLQLDHLCRVRHCCRPEHLEPVTGRENVLRGVTLPAANARKTRCPQGHPLDAVAAGDRRCSTCRREQARKQNAKR